MSTHTDKRATLTTCLGQDSSDGEGDVATSSFQHAQKKMRVSTATNETEDGVDISLKLPKASDDDELHALLWGSSAGAVSDDETEAKKRKGASGSNATNRNRRARNEMHVRGDDNSGAAASSTGGAAEGKGGENLWGMAMQPSSARKLHQESKELDRIEAAVLQAKQLQHLLQDHRSVMQVTVAKARGMLEKLQAKDSDDVKKMMLELIKQDGPTCRAAEVMQSLQDAKNLLESIVLFVEALRDQEASCDTLRSRANDLKELGVMLPRSLNMVMCRRSTEVLLNEGKLDYIFKFLNPVFVNEVPCGIASVLPDEEPLEKLAPMIMDFQSGCITHCVNQILLRDYSAANAGTPPNSE